MKAALAAVLGLVLALVSVARADDPSPQDESIAAWAQIYAVLEHPRCRNCHPAGDAPLQKDEGIPHAQNITRRSRLDGLTCAACHRSRNSSRKHGPPGAKGWNLPPDATPMVFEGRSSAALCTQLKDPEQNGHRDLEAIVEHMNEPLVKWAWDPGPGRTKPPISHDELAAAVRRWVDTGAACPSAP